jgi:hypothetical protein
LAWANWTTQEEIVPQFFTKQSLRLDVVGLLVIWICIDLQRIEGFDANVSTSSTKRWMTPKPWKRRAALELKP